MSPDVEQAQAHVRAILRTELPPSDRASRQGTLREEHADQIRRVMDRQAELVPHTVQRLEEITYDFRGLGGAGRMGSYNPEYGFGSPVSRGRERRRIYLNGRWAQADSRPDDYGEMIEAWDRYQEEGFTARSDLGPLEYTMSHEFGHHVMAMLAVYGQSPYGSGVDEYMPLVTVRPLLQAMDEHLGTDFMADIRNATYAMAGGRKVVSSDYLDKVIARHGDKLAAAISKYAGSGKFQETMAEIWQMYSAPGADPPPAVAAIGRIMQRLAERAARSES